MQRFFFNLIGSSADNDDTGVELAGVASARVEAVRYAGQVIRDRPSMVWTSPDVRVEVTDSGRRLLSTIIIMGIDAPAPDGSSMII